MEVAQKNRVWLVLSNEIFMLKYCARSVSVARIKGPSRVLCLQVISLLFGSLIVAWNIFYAINVTGWKTG